jgi:hypothetical protein
MLGATTDKSAQDFLSIIASNQTFTSDVGNKQAMFTAQHGDFNNAMRGASTAATSPIVMDLYKRDLQPTAQATSYGRMALNGDALLGGAVKSGVEGAIDLVGNLLTSPIKTVTALPGAVKDGFVGTGQAAGSGAAAASDPASRDLLNSLYGRSDAANVAAVVGLLPAAAMVAPVPVGGKAVTELKELKAAANAGRLEYNAGLAGLESYKNTLLKEGKTFEETFNGVSALRDELKVEVRKSTGPVLETLTNAFDTIREYIPIPGVGKKFDLEFVFKKTAEDLTDKIGAVPTREQVFQKMLESVTKPNELVNTAVGIGGKK